MADFNLFGGVSGMLGGGSFMTLFLIIILGLVGIAIVGGIIWYFYKRKA